MIALLPQLEGCYIFPIQPGTKDPATRTGWKEASNDPAQIERWARINPEFNWGIACGLSKVFVFDIDPGGLEWWADLQKRDPVIREAVARAFTVRTPKGGLHVYFKGEGPSTASRIAEGIDTRGGFMRSGKLVSGGYVVAPGSKTVAGPGRVTGSYTALEGGVIEPLPEFMAALVPERKKTDILGLEKNPDKDLPRNVKTAHDLIDNYVKSGRVSIEGKGGNNLAFQVCASILDKAISPGLAFEMLWEKWNPHCQPPWDDFELERIVVNAATHGEDTESGAKGHQSNQDAFANFQGMETPQEEHKPVGRQRRKLQFIHEFADSVEDPKWLLPGMLPSTGVGMLYGQSGSYKSFVALDLALTLAFGVAGQWENPTLEKQDVVFFAGESPIGMARMRFPAWMEAHDIEFRNDHRLVFNDKVPMYQDSETWEAVKQDLAELGVSPCLIVIDTKSRLITGMDENSSKDGTLVLNFLEQLSDYYQCCVLLIDHVGKDQSKGARGSSVYFANVDFAIEVKKMQRGMEMVVRKQKEADIEDAVTYYETKVYGNSIYLARTTTKPAQANKNAAPVAAWASLNEVCDLLVTEFGGSTSTAMLAQSIAGRVGVPKEKVMRTLISADELKILHNGNQWKSPGLGKQDYDL